MFSFTKEQQIHDISGIKIGGQPGKYPTVLFGGLFFKGEPEKKQAKNLLDKAFQRSEKTGNPVIPDFFIKKEKYIEHIMDIIEEILPEDHPFSIDIIDPVIKIKTLELLHQRNLLSRTIYNSIHIGITPQEEETLSTYPPEMVILVTFNPKDPSPDGKIEILENGAYLRDTGLIPLVQKLGVKKILIDTAALAPGENSGASIAAIPVMKEEYGFPTGCAIHNVVEKSPWLKEYPLARKPVDAGSNSAIPLFGGDFAIFGPMEHSDLVLPLVAWYDILISEYAENYFGVVPVDSHPRRKLLP